MRTSIPDNTSLGASCWSKIEEYGEVGETSGPIAVVPAGYWQMVRTTGEYTLVGCTMGPGFEFDDYQQLNGDPDALAEMQRIFPELAEFI